MVEIHRHRRIKGAMVVTVAAEVAEVAVVRAITVARPSEQRNAAAI